MKNKKLCGEKPCAECPFSKQSVRGWLADYTIDDLLMFNRFDVPFPCHMTMGKGDIQTHEVAAAIQSGKMRLCRGYAEMMKKSCKQPRPEWLAAIVNDITVGDDAMNTGEFIEHHTIQFKPIT